MPESAFIVTIITEASDPIGLENEAADLQAVLEGQFDVISVKAWAHPSMSVVTQPVVPPVSGTLQ